MVNTPSTHATRARARIAVSRPMTGLLVSQPAIAALNPPPRSWLSLAMFTTPARSPITPPRAPNTRGTASRTAPPMSRTTGKSRSLPAPAHERKATRRTLAKTRESQMGTLFAARTYSTAPAVATTARATHTQARGMPGTETLGTWKNSPAEEKRYFTFPARDPSRRRSTNSPVTTPNAIGALRLITVTCRTSSSAGAEAGAGAGAATAVIRSPPSGHDGLVDVGQGEPPAAATGRPPGPAAGPR